MEKPVEDVVLHRDGADPLGLVNPDHRPEGLARHARNTGEIEIVVPLQGVAQGRQDEVRNLGVYPYFRMIASGQDPVVTMNGQRVIMLGSNNYLGLTNHPEIKEAAAKALESYGTGTAGSRFLNGTLEIHVELEEKLAQFMRREAALTFSTGFQVNLGVISSLIDRKDVVVLDNLDHACILDGARLSFGRVLKYPHNDMEALEERLRSVDDDRSTMIIVDGVFSMEGDVADLPRIVELKKKFGGS